MCKLWRICPLCTSFGCARLDLVSCNTFQFTVYTVSVYLYTSKVRGPMPRHAQTNTRFTATATGQPRPRWVAVGGGGCGSGGGVCTPAHYLYTWQVRGPMHRHAQINAFHRHCHGSATATVGGGGGGTRWSGASHSGGCLGWPLTTSSYRSSLSLTASSSL